tara:strand:- start:38017 stop:38661 length:645 start_codon:yes stop_codon:yes gene_type:complete
MSTRPTIDECQQIFWTIVGIRYFCPLSRDKGVEGKLLERKLGIPTSSACLDCSDGEIKVVPFKRLTRNSLYGAAGDFVPKETVAITMANIENVLQTPYEDSRLCRKINNVLFISYWRDPADPDYITFMNCVHFNSDFKVQRHTIQADYETIQSHIAENGSISGKIGKMIQMRTKGAGGDAPKTRAFYFKKPFLKEIGIFYAGPPTVSETKEPEQ